MKVLAIRVGALGDTIVALPALSALAALPADVELVGTSPYGELAVSPGLATAVHSVDRAGLHALFDDAADDTELLEFLGTFDLVVAWSRLPLLAAKLRRLQVELLQGDPLPLDGVHASEQLFRVLEPLGLSGPAPLPRVQVDERPPGFSFGGRKFVAIHPSSGSAAKNWPAERFEALARSCRDAGLEVVWIQGEADADVVGRLAEAVPGRVALELPIRELAGLLLESAVFVGNDSGVSHLAAAVGTPTIALFRSTDPVQWAPRGPQVHVATAGASSEAVWGFACDLINMR